MTERRSTHPAAIQHFSSEDVDAWYKADGRRIFLGDVIDHTGPTPMSVGFARYDAGEANSWTLAYDEALIVTRGAFTVRSQDGRTAVTATGGEIIHLSRGAQIVYQAEEDTELVYVSYPHWFDATSRDPALADQLGTFSPA